MSAKDKTGLGYSTQLNELSSNHETDSENSLSIFVGRSSDDEHIPENDRFSKNRYKVVGNFLTPRADISFVGLDEYAIRNKIIESQTNDTNTVKPKLASESVVYSPKINRDSIIIEYWTSDDEEEVSRVQKVRPENQIVKTRDDKNGQNSHKQGVGFRKVKACFVCRSTEHLMMMRRKRLECKKSTEHLIKDCNFHDKKSQEYNLKNMVNTGVSTRTGLHRPSISTARPVCTARPSISTARPVCTARPSISTARPVCTARPSISTARPVCTARPSISTARPVYASRPIYPRMDNVRPRGSCSPIKRSYYTKPTFKPKDLKQDVKIFRVQNMSTARTRAVVNTGKGKLDTDFKKSRWVWRPKGNYLDHVSKDSGSFMLKKGNPEILLQDHAVVDSGCSSHISLISMDWRMDRSCAANSTHIWSYSDKHNMVAFLKKPNESVGFTKVVDFLKGTSLRYALTHNPTIYDSLVKQFWQTATVRTLANGTQQLVASIDSKEYTITEAYVRSKLQLADATGIHNLSDAEIYAGLATLGYVTEGAAVDQGEGSAQPAEPHHTPVDPISSTSQQPIPSPPHPSPPHPSLPPHSSPPHPSPPPHSPPFSPPHYLPSRSYEAPLHEGNTSRSAEDSMHLKELIDIVPRLVTKIETLETELQKTKTTYGKAILTLVKRDIDDDPLVSLVRESMKMKEKSTYFITPTKSSGEAQEEDISPTILEAAKTLSKVASQGVSKVKSTTDKCKRYKRRARSVAKYINTGLDAKEEINTGIEEATHKTKEQIRQEEAGLEEAIKLQAQMDEEVAKQIHLDEMIAKRMAEEEALSEQQKKRKAQV
ncbi:hypothetical protein Tco_0442695 [Tanacetum coccineum]